MNSVMPVPTWLLLLEVIILETVLVITFLRHRHSTGGIVAGILTIPIGYLVYVYAIYDLMPVMTARDIVRYGYLLLFFVLIAVFGRLSLKDKTNGF